jgi:hypothetical protein
MRKLNLHNLTLAGAVDCAGKLPRIGAESLAQTEQLGAVKHEDRKRLQFFEAK